jgi:hypothetical protein
VSDREKDRNKKERDRNARGLFSSPSLIVRGFCFLSFIFLVQSKDEKKVTVYASLILSFSI